MRSQLLGGWGGEEQPVCSHCGTDKPKGNWGRHPVTCKRLCGTCRNRVRGFQREERPVAVQCLQCGSSSPGTGRGINNTWHAHPATGKLWLCSPCFVEARRQADQRACLVCAATSSVGAKPRWYRHPRTGAEWVCGRCECRIRRQLKQQQQQHQQRRQQQASSGGSFEAGEEQHEHWKPAATGQQQKRQQSHKRAEQAPAQEDGAGTDSEAVPTMHRASARLAAKRRRCAAGEAQAAERDEQQAAVGPLWQQLSSSTNPAEEVRPGPQQREWQLQRSFEQQAAARHMRQPAAQQQEGEGEQQQICEPLSQQAQPPREQQAQPDLLEVLLSAAAVPAAAACGLDGQLAARFIALLERLPREQQAVKVG